MDEVISKRMAIDTFKDCAENGVGINGIVDALESLPPAQPKTNYSESPNSSDDTISRQAAIEALDKRFDSIPMEQTSEILMLRKDLRELPPIQSKRGKWIKISPANIYECSECGKSVMTNDICAYDFCHGCGTDMREVTT